MKDSERKELIRRMKLKMAEDEYRAHRKISSYTLPSRPISEEYPTLFNFGVTLALSGVFLVLINLL